MKDTKKTIELKNVYVEVKINNSGMIMNDTYAKKTAQMARIIL